MDEIAPLVGDVLMEFAVFLHHFSIILGPRLHAAQPSLHLRQFFQGLPKPVRRVRHGTFIGNIEVRHGVFQSYRRLWGRGDSFLFFYAILIQNGAIILPCSGPVHCNSLQFPPGLWATGKLRLDNPSLGHTDAVFCNVDGGTGCKFVIAGGEGIPIRFLPLELGIAEEFRAFEEYAECLGQPIVLLDECLTVHFFQKGGFFFVFCWSWDEVGVSF